MTRVLVLSPIPALRAGLRALLSADPDLEVVAAGASLADLPEELAAGEEGAPSAQRVAIATAGALDEAGYRLLAKHPDLALLLITDEAAEAQELAVQIMKGQPWGLLLPEASAEALQAAVHALAEGLVVLSPEALHALLLTGEMAGRTAPEGLGDDSAVEHLTAREVEVLRLVAQGLTNKQIGAALGISEHTVKFHVSSIYGKLGASNRSEAVRIGARQGWVPL